MKLLIDIDEELYKNVIEHTKEGYIGSDVWIAVAKGTPVSTEGDLISRKALKEDINSLYEYDTYNEEFDAGVQSIINFIDNAPTVNLEKTSFMKGYNYGCDDGKRFYERPQGAWIGNAFDEHHCNRCGHPALWEEEPDDYYESQSNFCPNCGAEMRGEEE